MNSKIKLIAVALVIWAIQGLHCQNSSKGINDPKAHQHLKNVSKKITQASCLQIQFDYTLENTAEKIQDNKTGSMVMKQSMYILNFMGLNVRSDGKTVWSYNKDLNEVQVSEPEEGGLNIMNPLSILKSYDKHFRAKYIRGDTFKGVKVHVIDLVPLAANTFHKVRILSRQDNHQLVQCILYDTNGTAYSYTIRTWNENVKCLSSDFTFNKSQYPNVSVVDMR